MSTAGIAIVVNGADGLALILAAWHLVRSGRVRLSSPTVAQLQAEGQQAAAETPVQAAELKAAS